MKLNTNFHQNSPINTLCTNLLLQQQNAATAVATGAATVKMLHILSIDVKMNLNEPKYQVSLKSVQKYSKYKICCCSNKLLQQQQQQQQWQQHQKCYIVFLLRSK